MPGEVIRRCQREFWSGWLRGLCWAKDYFVANPEEGAARIAANLEPVVDPAAERHREESANIEKYLWGPTAVKVDSEGRLYIVESCRHRVQIYLKA